MFFGIDGGFSELVCFRAYLSGLRVDGTGGDGMAGGWSPLPRRLAVHRRAQPGKSTLEWALVLINEDRVRATAEALFLWSIVVFLLYRYCAWTDGWQICSAVLPPAAAMCACHGPMDRWIDPLSRWKHSKNPKSLVNAAQRELSPTFLYQSCLSPPQRALDKRQKTRQA